MLNINFHKKIKTDKFYFKTNLSVAYKNSNTSTLSRFNWFLFKKNPLSITYLDVFYSFNEAQIWKNNITNRENDLEDVYCHVRS